MVISGVISVDLGDFWESCYRYFGKSSYRSKYYVAEFVIWGGESLGFIVRLKNRSSFGKHQNILVGQQVGKPFFFLENFFLQLFWEKMHDTHFFIN